MIDKMVSMVFNIYNKSIYDSIISWNGREGFYTNKVPIDCTIDRHIEDCSNLQVVTTSKFLVGHQEELSSTLFGREANKSYVAMIDNSMKELDKKVIEYINEKELKVF
ncbi:MAG TPA: hypothetical protein DDY68_00500 [Porphyromonadaceae bacterium]|nr:hypothetical protein [Porphyromonadaceae bacterium]